MRSHAQASHCRPAASRHQSNKPLWGAEGRGVGSTGGQTIHRIDQ